MRTFGDELPVLRMPINGGDRQSAGVIVTAREQTTGLRDVFHRAGPDALRAVCDVIDALDGDWRVLSICTPDTIYRDLQGTRAAEWGAETSMPEPTMLGRIGRLDLLDPFFLPSLPRGHTHG